ncbi:hypothetical protein ACHAPT_007394 [Fusarium lateritium]
MAAALNNASASSDSHSAADFCFAPPSGGFLDLLPEQYDDHDNNNNDYDFATLDTDAIYQSLDWNLDAAGTGMLDGAVMPDMTVAAGIEQTDLGIGEDFLSREPPLINITNSQQQQPTPSPPLPPPTTTNNKSPSIPGTSTFSLHPSPAASSSSASSSSRKRKSSPEDESAAVALKRQRNTLAARKYRQKRLDRISELEAALAAMTGERDDMRLQLARREAEVDALREMLSKK